MNEWDFVWRLGPALALSAAIGLDRELRRKSAGPRTYALVGAGSALFMPSWASTASSTSSSRAK